MSTLLATIEAAQRSATVSDVIEKMRRGGYASYEVAQLGWGMGHAQLDIEDAVAEASRKGLVAVEPHFRSRKNMAALTDAGWAYPLPSATVADLIFQVRRGVGQVRTIDEVAYSLNVEPRTLAPAIRQARELGLIAVGRDSHSMSGLLGLTGLGRGYCVTHNSTTGESKTAHGHECFCNDARMRRPRKPVLATTDL